MVAVLKRQRPGLVAALAAAVAALVVQQVSALAAGPFPKGSAGYDVSYPQACTNLPAGSFGVVGISHGRPFDVVNGTGGNPCLAQQYAHWKNHALYLNTGYDPSYVTGHMLASCAAQESGISGTAAQQQAWGVGCSFATDQQQYAYAAGAANPTSWWLDVEIANSWSSSDLSLNAYTLRGAVTTLGKLTPGIAVGVYSTSSMWASIVGSNTVSGLAADWVATGQRSQRAASPYCRRSFTGAPVWLVQWLGKTFDQDLGC